LRQEKDLALPVADFFGEFAEAFRVGQVDVGVGLAGVAIAA